MVKSRLSLVDVIAMVRDLSAKLTGMRLLNVYDVDQRVFFLKFGEPGRDKEMLLVESGIRLHTTNYARDKNKVPGGFCMKLRKHIRTKRLVKIAQLGVDRIVDLTFGGGEYTHHLLLEFYAGGNIILTDSDYRILSALRYVDTEQTGRIAAKEQYPIEKFSIDTTREADTALARDFLKEAWKQKLTGKLKKKSQLKAILSKPGSGVSQFG